MPKGKLSKPTQTERQGLIESRRLDMKTQRRIQKR